MRKIKIFLASSEELKTERLEIAELIGHMNLALEHSDLRLLLVKWEYLDASMSEIHKQDEYNKVLDKCDICIVLFATKFGKYTNIELHRAYQKLIKNNKGKQLAVFFREETEISPELEQFKLIFHEEFPEIHTFEFNDIKSLRSGFLKIWNEYQQQNLSDDFPVIFSNGKAILISEVLV